MARINKTLATYERVAVEKEKGPIAEAVNSLIRYTEFTILATSVCSLLAAASILLTTLGIDAFIEKVGQLCSQREFASFKDVHLAQKQAKAIAMGFHGAIGKICSDCIEHITRSNEPDQLEFGFHYFT